MTTVKEGDFGLSMRCYRHVHRGRQLKVSDGFCSQLGQLVELDTKRFARLIFDVQPATPREGDAVAKEACLLDGMTGSIGPI